ncbi:hypothetical protein HOY82DRAFT_536689 [Tuber indicum]|nr:hypothetical protein HOY82DRAFT_536689 [Tuber indicum]
MDSPRGNIHTLTVHLRTKTLQLVLTDATGIAQPLPADLGPLPLYPLDDGSYSVLDPSLSHTTHQDQATGSTNSTLACDISATLTPQRERRSTHLLPSILHMQRTWLHSAYSIQDETGTQQTL